MIVNHCFLVRTVHRHTPAHTHVHADGQQTQPSYMSESLLGATYEQASGGAPGTAADFVDLMLPQTHTHQNTLMHMFTDIRPATHEHENMHVCAYTNTQKCTLCSFLPARSSVSREIHEWDTSGHTPGHGFLKHIQVSVHLLSHEGSFSLLLRFRPNPRGPQQLKTAPAAVLRVRS